MKDHKEIMEALLAGETLVNAKSGRQCVLLEGLLRDQRGDRVWPSFCDPADWSILDTTVGLLEALAALEAGKQVRHKQKHHWMYAHPDGIIRFIDNGAAAILATDLTTARFIVRDKP
jgi:hypothetical protein